MAEANINYIAFKGMVQTNAIRKNPEYAYLVNLFNNTVLVDTPKGLQLHVSFIDIYQYNIKFIIPRQLIEEMLLETGIKEENLHRFETFEDVRNWFLFLEYKKDPNFLNFKK